MWYISLHSVCTDGSAIVSPSIFYITAAFNALFRPWYRNNSLVVFCPFVNRDYENNWEDTLRVEGESLEAYYDKKGSQYRDEEIIVKSKW